MFYRYSMRKTTDDFKHDVILTRYEIARDKTSDAKRQLDKYIYA